jgi:hypothetical protein
MFCLAVAFTSSNVAILVQMTGISKKLMKYRRRYSSHIHKLSILSLGIDIGL